MLGVIIEYSIHPTNRVYHALTPQPRSFLRELPTLGAFGYVPSTKLFFLAIQPNIKFIKEPTINIYYLIFGLQSR